jgi:hypothetical protein
MGDYGMSPRDGGADIRDEELGFRKWPETDVRGPA